jgi:ferredoxin
LKFVAAFTEALHLLVIAISHNFLAAGDSDDVVTATIEAAEECPGECIFLEI